MLKNLPTILKIISKELYRIGATAIIVGGAVRDYYLNLSIKDYDLEIYGLDTLEQLECILLKYGSVNIVGKSFGVLKFKYDGDEYDFSFPRKESKTGVGHRGFKITIDNNLSFQEASRRRDFTINAMGFEIEKDIFLDPYNGLLDIKNKKIKHIDDLTFIEDPLRVYRAIQFCARFEFILDEKSFILCQNMVKNNILKTISKERIFEELSKLLLKAEQPSIGFYLMKSLGMLEIFPELETINFRDLDYKNLDIKGMYVLLLRKLKREKILSFLYKITDSNKFIEDISLFIEYYQMGSLFFKNCATDADIKRLATKINISDLTTIAKYDDKVANSWLLQKAQELEVDKKPLKPTVTGKDLINIGLKPSPQFKKILEEIYDLELEGIDYNIEDIIQKIKYEASI